MHEILANSAPRTLTSMVTVARTGTGREPAFLAPT